MEDAKRTTILETAIALFLEKGYNAASMQDMAEACGMAKASIYKVFSSKEELFTAAFVACHRRLLEQAAELDREGVKRNWTPKEKLRRKIEFQLEYFVANHHLIVDLKELPVSTNEQFVEAWRRKKNALHAWRRELLIEAYGERIEPFVWDVVAIFRGILNEYWKYVKQKVLALPMTELSAFLVDRLDAVVDDFVRTAPKPILDQRNTFFNEVNPSDTLSRQATVQQLIGFMTDKLEEPYRPSAERVELRKVVDLLAEACERDPRDPTLIRVFSAYLDAAPELRPYLRQLHYLLS